MRRLIAGSMCLAAAIGTTAWISFTSSATPAFANSQAYELYCPKTPVGNVVINGVMTTATITPANPAAGSQFSITNYQTTLTLNTTISKIAFDLQPNVQGTANASVDASGATPATLAVPAININTPITDGGVNGVPLSLPASPETVGPFTASGGAITMTEADTASLTLLLNGEPLPTTCTAYPNNANPTGLISAAASGTPTPPVIATSSSGSAATTAPSSATTTTAAAAAATTPTTVAPATAPADSPLASTGAGPGLALLAEVGAALVLFAMALIAFEPSRKAFARVLSGARRHRE